MTLPRQINFETEICDHLAAHRWLYDAGDSSRYDRARALFPEDVFVWVNGTQPKAWGAIVSSPAAHAPETLLSRVRDHIDQRVTPVCKDIHLEIRDRRSPEPVKWPTT